MKALTPDGKVLVENKINELNELVGNLKKVTEVESIPSHAMQKYIQAIGALQALKYMRDITAAHENVKHEYPFVLNIPDMRYNKME